MIPVTVLTKIQQSVTPLNLTLLAADYPLIEKAFIGLSLGVLSPEDLYFLNSKTLRLTNVQGNIIPQCIEFCYMYGGFTNLHYDLEVLNEILSSNPQITLLDEHRRPTHRSILSKPSHLTAEGFSHYAAFRFMPTSLQAEHINFILSQANVVTPFIFDYNLFSSLDFLQLNSAKRVNSLFVY